MFGSEILEVAIGVIFVFVLVSIICTAVREGLEAWLKTRAAYLERGIRELLRDAGTTGLTTRLYEHPLIYGLFSGEYAAKAPTGRPSAFARGRGLPSYIPSKNFALALMDIAARGPVDDPAGSSGDAPVLSLASVRANIAKLGNPAVQRVLLTAIDSAQGDLDKAQANIQAWFDSGMDRVSGWYKRATQWIIFGIGLIVAVAMNINTISVADYLYRNSTAREAIVARAQSAATDTAFLERNYDSVRSDLAALSLPIGWAAKPGMPRWVNQSVGSLTCGDWLLMILGWLLTALAATLGAPFWFDLLNKVMVIRSTVKPHEKSREEGSEDRKDPKPAAVQPAAEG